MIYTDRIYGKAEIEGLLAELIETKTFQRLKRIHQGGAIFIANPKINHTRFEHSIGVMILIQKLGGNLESQIAGLLHDISHTAFSHLIDYMLEYEDEDYHEERFEDVLAKTEIRNLLEKHYYSHKQFSNLEKFTILEYPLPSLSVDRVDYTLRDLFQLEEIKKEEIDWFVDGLVLKEDRVFVRDMSYAKWFREKYDFLVNQYFNGSENKLVNIFMTSLIDKYYKEGKINIMDFHQDDYTLIREIESLSNKDIYALYEEWKKEQPHSEGIKIKQRVIDPEILFGDQIMKLSELG